VAGYLGGWVDYVIEALVPLLGVSHSAHGHILGFCAWAELAQRHDCSRRGELGDLRPSGQGPSPFSETVGLRHGR